MGEMVRRALETALGANPLDVWLCHLKIHYCEMGPVDAFDWAAAEVVRSSDATGAGHLIHMPTHLDIQVGAYERAMQCNIRGYQADLALYAIAPKRFGIYAGYVVHNIQFCGWAAMYAGHLAIARQAANVMDGFLTETTLRSNPLMPTFFEAYTALSLMVLVRFGRWDEILGVPFRDDKALYLTHTMFLHFARALALGVQPETLQAARAEQKAFDEMFRALQPGDRMHHNVNLLQMATIAERVLEGELCYRAGEHDDAFDALAEATAHFDALPYDEPHGWLMSTRQTMGALLTEQKRYDRAMELYEEDLTLFPRNPWALAGLKRCLMATRRDAARLEEVHAALALALHVADEPIDVSCKCARSELNASLPASATNAGPALKSAHCARNCDAGSA